MDEHDRRLIEAVRRTASPLQEGAPVYDALLDLVGDARFALLGDASHGTHEFYRDRAHITKRLIVEKHSPRSLSKRTGLTRTASTDTCAARVRTKTRRRRSAASSGSRPGCGATPMSSTSSDGCATTTRRSQPRDAWDFTDWISTACRRRSRRSFAISTRSTRRRRDGPGTGTAASSISHRIRRRTGTRRPSG
jgi:hypothetical protein